MIDIEINRVNVSDHKYSIKKPNGITYHTNIHIVGKIIQRMKAGFSPIVMICGGQRVGKSYFGVWLAYVIMNFFYDTLYPVKQNTFYDPVESINRIGDTDKQPIMIDEAGAYLNKSEWYDKVVKAMDRIIQTQGYKANCYIFISPFGSDIAKTFRKHFDFQIYVRRRGIAVTRQIPKKYDTLKDEPVKMFRLEQVVLTKKSIPRELWNEYEKFSMRQKEELRKLSYKATTRVKIHEAEKRAMEIGIR